MKYSHIIVVITLVLTIAVCGCLHGVTSPKPSTGPTATTGASVTPVTSGLPVYRPIVDFQAVHRFEYKFNTTTGDMPEIGSLKVERTLAPFGGSGNVTRIMTNKTSSTSAGLSRTYVDEYIDPSSGAALGGHINITTGGQLLANRDIAPGEIVSTAHTSTPVLTAAMDPDLLRKLVSAGNDTIVVPAGTYACGKYTVKTENSVMTYWITRNVPIPVKMVTADNVTGKVTMTMELASYA